ncbi:hypothetical protein [Pseudoduganella chitinolytica]|uniref:Uncharacterized protein n=1 Tax=Pseudoduganella chitinolytica TaxID=34070 RepID=A0ABY8BHY4_9BURK|nr:hypothetical protein [Pseudoduganella chitinolytica]WEF34558.1 hypothetical protein PX653_07275 [Pseudoduganella chitinolytica]
MVNVSSKKLYAMQRMSRALERAAAQRPFGSVTDRALRWAAAWGMASGIRAPRARVRLRRSTLVGVAPWERDTDGGDGDGEPPSPFW